MKFLKPLTYGALFFVGSAIVAVAAVNVATDHVDNDHATAELRFKSVRAPSHGDAAAQATFTLVDGIQDGNGGELAVLHDGRLPTEADQPGENFFFRAGTDGGRILLDLGRGIKIQQVNTYSWHVDARGPQVYTLFASDGKAPGFSAQPKRGSDPEACGWKRVATVDTRPQGGTPGGQYAVSVSDSEGVLGEYRYLLFDIHRTEDADSFGNTFYSEIDVVDRDAPLAVEAPAVAVAAAGKKTITAGEGRYRINLDTSEVPDLTEVVDQRLVPVVQEWYPKLVELLPSAGFTAPTNFSIVFKRDMAGVADTSGTRIRVAAKWFRENLQGESIGSVVHEMVHVVQQYGGRRRDNPEATRVPGWLTEGLTDYIRWYQYEPQSHGAEITRRSLARARYDGSYRVTANFLNWVSEKYDRSFVPKLNAIIREGNYNEQTWTKLTGHTLPELGASWKQSLAQKLGVELPPVTETAMNTLSDAEKAAGWKLLFDGNRLAGWHNFKRDGVRPGWRVQDGSLTCTDPQDAGDIVTTEAFGWFELQLDYNISEGGNSGIMYHVTDAGGAAWATGPEFQLEDNAKAADPVRCGWLYALYQPPQDPKTGRPLDATKPAGEWNHVRLLISPEKCEHEINGVKYFEYALGSEDFNQRVAKSKFGNMPGFAKSNTGALALQGDHGQVAFRNVKVRPVTGTK